MDHAFGPVLTALHELDGTLGAAILLLSLTFCATPALGQVDTTDAPVDTVEAVADTAGVAADTTRAGPDTTDIPSPTARQAPAQDTVTAPEDPAKFRDPIYGRPPIDSLPAITPHVGLEHMIAQARSSFLYDLGAVGWPHGWSYNGLEPNRARLWLEGHPYNSPLTGRARFDLLPTSLLQKPGIDIDPGGGAVGVHTAWREYDQIRPITELRYRRDSNGQKAIEVAHSQQHALPLFGTGGLLQITFGYGGRTTAGAYQGTDLRRERRIWGRVRYHAEDWAFELSDLSSRRRIGAHSGVLPQEGAAFQSIYLLPRCEACSQGPSASRRTFRNDLTARLHADLLPRVEARTELSATWTSNTFDFATGTPADTTWTVKTNGGHARLQQSVEIGAHTLTLGARGSLWNVGRSNVPPVEGSRWSTHASARDSVELWETQFVLDAGWHATSNQQYPSASVQIDRSVGPFGGSASVSTSGRRLSWFETAGFPGYVQPISSTTPIEFGRLIRGRVGLNYSVGRFDFQVDAFGHQIRNAVDLYSPPASPTQRLASADSVLTRRTNAPVRRVGGTVSMSWRRASEQGIYATASGTALHTLSKGQSLLQTRLARTLPTVYGRGRIGARFIFFTDLKTDLFLQARGWTSMNSRWFHPPTGRLVVPPANTPVPVLGAGFQPGPSGTVDAHAEIKLRGATLFFTFENIQSSFAPPGSYQRRATIIPGTYIVPVYPLPARQFRFGVHWPIFD